MRLEVFLARKYLGSQKGKGLSVITWIALAGVILGVMSLITVLAVMSGFEKELRSKILGNNAHIVVSSYEIDRPGNPAFSRILEKVQKTEGVRSAMPVVYGEAFILSPTGDSDGAFIKAVDTKLVRDVLDLDEYVFDQNWKAFDEGGIILGLSLARSLGVQPGDQITLLLNRAELSPLGVVPRMKKIMVADVFHSGMTQYDGRHAYLGLSVAEKLFDRKPRQIEVRAEDVRHIDFVRDQIQKELGEAADVRDWLSVNEDFLSALRLEKTVMAIILGLIVLVAAFNIAGSLIMIVRDKTRDIAIMKSMGAEDSTVLRTFFLQGIFIGLVGTVVGLILGVALSFILKEWIEFPLNPDVYMIDQVPVDLRISDVVIVAIGALIISSLATLYPAKLAASLNPTIGLKVE